MEFKSLFFRKNIQIMNFDPKIHKSFNDFEIIEIRYFQEDKFLCFRIERLQDPSKYGVMNIHLNKSVSLKEELDNQPIRIQDFIIIDQVKKDIFYTGSKAIVESIILYYYRVDKKNIVSRISLSNLKYLHEIKITEYPNAQRSVFAPDSEINVVGEISDLFEDSDPYECIEHKYKLKNSIFKRDKLRKLLEESTLDTTFKFSLEGEDKFGNRIKYNDGIFARKFEILIDEKYQNYEIRKNTSLKMIKDELKKVIK